MKVKFVKIDHFYFEEDDMSAPSAETDWIELSEEDAKKAKEKMCYHGYAMVEWIDSKEILDWAKVSSIEKADKTYISVESVIGHIIHYCKEKSFDISPPKLQKLLYFTQGWHLAFFDEPLFDEKFEAWVHGPTIERIHKQYKEFLWGEIIQDGVSRIDGEIGDHIDNVLNAYAKRSAISLELVTCQDDAWRSTRGRKRPDENCTDIISNKSMKRYFKYLREKQTDKNED